MSDSPSSCEKVWRWIKFRDINSIVMLTMAIWWLGIVLEALLLVRGLRAKLIGRFPIFYSYILFVFVEEILRLAAYRWYLNEYSQVYWITQFVSLVIGSAVIFEIYHVGLRPFPGTARMARYLLLFIFGLVFVEAVADPTRGLFLWLAESAGELERSLRVLQALSILTLVALFLWYAIPFGRNLRGILCGYGLFIATRTVQLYLLPFYSEIKVVWPYLQPFAYSLVLGLWASALWSADRVPEIQPTMQLEYDYQMLAASTRSQLQRTLARLGWAARP